MESNDCKEVTSLIHKRTLSLIAKKATQLFSDVEKIPDDIILQDHFIQNLERIWQAGDVYSILQSSQTTSNFCGKVFKNGEPGIFCRDCQTDPTCCLCLSCFENSEHKNHNYRMFASGGGGCCDCGDPEAWTDHVFCKLHRPSDTTSEDNPLKNLPSDLCDNTQSFFFCVLWYCMSVLNMKESDKLPSTLIDSDIQKMLSADTHVAIVMNDEVHSFNEKVINGLKHNVGMSHEDAVSLTNFIDRKGRGFFCKGTLETCNKAKDDINKNLRENPLNVTVFHSIVVAHQNCALVLINFLKELAERSQGFCRLLSMAMSQPNPDYNNLCILDHFFINDNSSWIDVRLSWHRLIMASIYKDFQYKKHLAVSLCTNYTQLVKNYYADSHKHDVCAVNLTVQLLTVPSLSHMLVIDHGLLEVVVNTVRELLTPFWNDEQKCLILHTPKFKYSRIVYNLVDLEYILRNRPDGWTDVWRTRTRGAVDSFVKLLSMLDSMDSFKKQQGAHVLLEPPWEKSFDFSITLQSSFLLFLEWCGADQQVLLDSINIAVTQYQRMTNYTFRYHICDQWLIGINNVELPMFDMHKDKVTFHQYLPRFIAGLLCNLSKYNLSLSQVFNGHYSNRQYVTLMEPCLRAVVLSSEILNGWWRRNGIGVMNQAMHYQFMLICEMSYKKDIVMLQSMANQIDPNTFVYALLYKYHLVSWVTNAQSENRQKNYAGEDVLRRLITGLEELLYLLIVIYGERYNPGIGEGVTMEMILERELIHIFYCGPCPHSQVMKKLRVRKKVYESEAKINELIKKVARLKKISGKAVFELKEEYAQYYDPFYYHYSKIEQSKSEEIWRKNARTHPRAPDELPICAPPSFTTTYSNVVKISHSPVIVRVLLNVFRIAATEEDTKYWSIRLLHECLHFTVLSLIEENNHGTDVFKRGCLGFHSANENMLPYLEKLKSNPNLEENYHLLVWIINILTEAAKSCGMTVSSQNTTSSNMEVDVKEEVDHGLPNAKKMKAEEHRKRLMAQMSKMQKDFYSLHKDELELIETTSSSSVATRAKEGDDTSNHSAVSCAVGVASLTNPSHSSMSADCILCQEDSQDIGMETDKSFVMSSIVQRSSVLRKMSVVDPDKKVDYLSGLQDNKWGIYSGGCGHVLHSVCWQNYVDNKKQEHARRHFFYIPGRSIVWEDGEFLCPLCQTFGNTVIPLSSPLIFNSPCKLPSCDVSHDQRLDLVRAAISRGNEVTDSDTRGSSVDISEFNVKMSSLFSNCTLPTVPATRVSISGNVHQMEIESMFFQYVFMQGYNSLPDETNECVPIAQWQNCIYTISGLEHSARNEGKFLFDYITTRQVDCVVSLVRLGWTATDRVETRTLAEYGNKLCNILMPAMSAFSEQPSVVDMDVFNLIVNLHFIISSLFNRLTTDKPHLPSENPYLASLIGLIDELLISVGTVVQIMQYLLCCSADMETDDPSEVPLAMDSTSDVELQEGTALQELWRRVRQFAGCSNDDPPPSPYSLYIGVQEHLFPFLQSTALFFKCLTGINFIHSSASGETNFVDLCNFLNLPVSLSSLFKLPVIERLCENLCCHPKLTELMQNGAPAKSPPLALVSSRKFAEIPMTYAELIKIASEFKCPQSKMNIENNESRTVMMCLICGQLICSSCNFCRIFHPDDESIEIGGLTQHSRLCGGGFGMAIWIVKSYVVLLDASDINHVRGCMLDSPYIDEYSEADPGLNRGNPLKFYPDGYKEMQQLWVNHQLPERIRKEMEQNLRLMRLKWNIM